MMRWMRLRPGAGRPGTPWAGKLAGAAAGRLRFRRHRVRTLLVVTLSALLVLGLGGYLLLGSGRFLAERVEVSGAHRLPAAVIVRAAAVPDRVPLVRLDTAAVADRVAGLPAVARVDVRRHWPHTVRISVTERLPLIAVRRPGGYSLVDAAGVALATTKVLPPNLPVAALARLGPADPATAAVLGVVQALSPKLRVATRRLEASSDSAVTLVLRDGRRVMWGANDRTALKAEILAALLRRPGRVYDVSAPDVVTVAR